MFGTVAIDVAPTVNTAEARVAVDSCTKALGADRCWLVRDRQLRGEWRAVVRWDKDSSDVVQIDYFRSSDPTQPASSRQLTFSATDRPRERWASIGVLVAAFVASRAELEAEEQPVEEPAPSPPPPVTEEPPKRKRGAKASVDLGFVVAHRLQRLPPQLGATLRGSVGPARLPVFARASVSYLHRPAREPQISWTAGSLGFGVRVGPDGGFWSLEMRSEAVLQQWLLRASEPGRQENDSLLRYGPQLGVDLVLRPDPTWHLFVGAEVTALLPDLSLDVGGQTVDEAPILGGSAVTGIRFAP